MSHRAGLLRDFAFTPARAAAPDESLGSPFLAFCAKALSPIPLQGPSAPDGRFFKTPAPPVFGGSAATAGGEGTARKRSDVAPLPLSAPLHFVATADGRGGPGRARGPVRDLASLGAAAHGDGDTAGVPRGAAFGAGFTGLPLSMDSPRVPASGGVRRLAARRPRDEADPARQAFAARQAGAAAATTAAKSLRRTPAESPQSASAAAAIRRRCLTFETPRPGSARARARAAGTPGASVTARTPQPGTLTTPGPRRRGRTSLDSAPSTGGMAPPETPDFGSADGAQLPHSRSGGGGSCRKCHCKKSKCLKLYCECFASGTYCDSGDGVACNCQNCLNTPCNAGLVAQTRQLIESRNPLAFCPKIVVKSLTGDDADDETPRHKKGCHCKKSNCLKRYCECYQAGVLCTDACRCDGCKNCSASGGGGHQHGPFALPVAMLAPSRSSLRAAGSTPLPNTPAMVMSAAEPQLAIFSM